MNPKKQFYDNQAHTIMKALEKRGMKGYYIENKSELLPLLDELITDQSTVAFGGSMTLKESGAMEHIRSRNITLHDRTGLTDPEEVREIYLKAFASDYYLMSTNAITLDGKLVNIDGNGNRVAALIYGPKEVIVITGMNKVALNEEEAISRVRNIASPPNTVRLNMKTPCATLGKCMNCLVDDCICCQTVITRKSRVKNRIKVIMIGENLGY